MARRNKAPQVASTNNDEAMNETMAHAIVTAETVEEAEDDILAALEAADDATNEGTGGEIEEVVVTAADEVDVTLTEQDEDAVLAALEATDTATPAKKTRTKKGPAATVTVVQRSFCDVADHFDPAGLKTALDGIAAKKVAEKAQNVVQAIEQGKKLSGFTSLAIRTAVAKGRVSSKDFIEAYQTDNKTIGTARAQAQQMTALFKALGLATPDGRDLVMADNALVKELTLIAA